MKTLQLFFIASLIFASVTVSDARTFSNDVEATITTHQNTGVIVRVDNNTNQQVKVEIRDKFGNIIHSQLVKDQKFRAKFSFSLVADGEYTILVSDKSGVVVSKEIAVFTSRQVAMR
jgi:hypothetical protein